MFVLQNRAQTLRIPQGTSLLDQCINSSVRNHYVISLLNYAFSPTESLPSCLVCYNTTPVKAFMRKFLCVCCDTGSGFQIRRQVPLETACKIVMLPDLLQSDLDY